MNLLIMILQWQNQYTRNTMCFGVPRIERFAWIPKPIGFCLFMRKEIFVSYYKVG